MHNGFLLWHRHLVVFLKQIAEVLYCFLPDETGSILLRIAIEPIVGIVVVEEGDIFVGCVVKTIFKSNVVEERCVLLCLNRSSC